MEPAGRERQSQANRTLSDIVASVTLPLDRLPQRRQGVAATALGAIAATAVFGLLAGAPPNAQSVDKPDLGGVWLATSPRSAGGANRPQLTPRAQADANAFDPLDDPVIRCVAPGFPRSGLIIYPFEIVQTEDIIVFLYETFGMVRRIYMDGRELPDYLPPAISGYSVGRWEGDELIVDTTGVAPGLLSGGGIPQYGDVSVVERYRLVDEGRGLELDVTVSAPETFVDSWDRSFTWEQDPDGMIFESICDPEDARF